MTESLRTTDSNFIMEAIEKYSDTLIRISYSYMRNMSDAEDMTQDAFLQLIKKKPSFENDLHEKAWLIRVTINLCKNRLKTAWFRKTLPLGEARFDFTEKESEVMSAVFELPTKYRNIIHLFYFEEYRISEIATILGQKESTIGSQLHRARKMLKPKLKEDFDDE
ncbi:MAG TPA: sigma-70 family RNA polymerase sigma factor [Ruminiclostridium sp.]